MHKFKNNYTVLILLGTLFFIIGCGTPPPPIPKVKIVEKPKYTPHIPQRTRKSIKLKEVQDDNFSSDYMYPAAKKKKQEVSVAPIPKNQTISTDGIEQSSTDDMTTATCIHMIGQEKFDKYTQMLGSESAALKRCKLLKSM